MNRFEKRVGLLQKKLKEREFYFLSSEADVSYLTGFTGDSAYVLLSADELHFFTDGRYTTQINEEKQVALRLEEIGGKRRLSKAISEILRERARASSVFYLHKSEITLSFFDALQEKVSDLELDYQDADFVKMIRMKKDDLEIEQIRQNLMLTELGFAKVLPLIQAGMTELEVAAELEHLLKKMGAEGMSFETIIAANERAALPHGVASGKKIEENSLILMDFGIFKKSYASDFTRCYSFGTIIDSEISKIRSIVEDALHAAEDVVRPGTKAGDVDKAARDVIEKAGYGEYFGHSTGHGVGLEIHEAPGISSGNDTVLQPGMVFTVEPGIYLPGRGGIRLEDMVVVTKNGSEVLTSTDYDL